MEGAISPDMGSSALQKWHLSQQLFLAQEVSPTPSFLPALGRVWHPCPGPGDHLVTLNRPFPGRVVFFTRPVRSSLLGVSEGEQDRVGCGLGRRRPNVHAGACGCLSFESPEGTAGQETKQPKTGSMMAPHFIERKLSPESQGPCTGTNEPTWPWESRQDSWLGAPPWS